VIETKPKELVVGEQAMIMEIVNACQDILEDAAQAKAAGLELPSLEEERAAHEAIAAKLAEDHRAKEAKRKELENIEEQQMLNSLVEEELKRQKAKAKETKRKNQPPSLTVPQLSRDISAGSGLLETLTFDQPIHLLDVTGNSIVCQEVIGKILIRVLSVGVYGMS
jgi:translation initiation factor 2-alpha kinase 4